MWETKLSQFIFSRVVPLMGIGCRHVGVSLTGCGCEPRWVLTAALSWSAAIIWVQKMLLHSLTFKQLL